MGLFRRGDRLKPNQYLLMNREDGASVGAIVAHSGVTGDRILRHIDAAVASGIRGHGGAVSAFVADVVASAAPIVATSLQAGTLLQVVGTPRLLEGLSSGTYTLLQTSTGFLGTVADSSSRQLVGQLRFVPASSAAIVAPVLAWQVLHTLAGVRQLAQVNERLAFLQRGIQQVIFRQQTRTYAQLLGTMEAIDDLDAEYSLTGRFTDDMRERLALAQRDVRCAVAEAQVHFEQFEREKRDVLSIRGKDGVSKVLAVLEGPSRVLPRRRPPPDGTAGDRQGSASVCGQRPGARPGMRPDAAGRD